MWPERRTSVRNPQPRPDPDADLHQLSWRALTFCPCPLVARKNSDHRAPEQKVSHQTVPLRPTEGARATYLEHSIFCSSHHLHVYGLKNTRSELEPCMA